MENLLSIIGTGITVFLSSIFPRSWARRVNHLDANMNDAGDEMLQTRLQQAERRNKELEARVAELEQQLRRER
jgi:uncharacterized membrane protein YgaE (UPF0421/DUF939 family)